MYSLLHLECHFFKLKSQSMFWFSRSFLPRSVEKRPMKLRLNDTPNAMGCINCLENASTVVGCVTRVNEWFHTHSYLWFDIYITHANVLRKPHWHIQMCWGKRMDIHKVVEENTRTHTNVMNNTWTHTNVFRKTYWHIQMCLEKHACVKENAYVSTRTHTCMRLVCVKSKIEMGHVTCMNLSDHTSEENHVANTHDTAWYSFIFDTHEKCVFATWPYICDSCVFGTWVSNIKSHATHLCEQSHMVMSQEYKWVMSHIWMSHVTHMNESCHTHEWVMSDTLPCHK